MKARVVLLGSEWCRKEVLPVVTPYKINEETREEICYFTSGDNLVYRRVRMGDSYEGDFNDEKIHQLLEQDPSEVLLWLNDKWPPERLIANGNVWLGFAYTAGRNAKERVDLNWAQIAIGIYDRLSALELADSNSDTSMQLKAMSFRIHMISKKGVVLEDPVLDPNIIYTWFFSNLQFTYDEAKKFASLNVRQIEDNFDDSKEFQHWIDIVERLTIFENLLNSGIPLNQSIEPWRALRHEFIRTNWPEAYSDDLDAVLYEKPFGWHPEIG